ncbi:MAG: MurR/RpiR family transcriptional regulator [Ruminococcaceae bacterium]|nr:MurR/RpiR family transcriptional regulator [Oscillospiraceae bacterium]
MGCRALKSNLTSRIVSRMNGFSKGQKRIAQYILEHYDEAAFMTAFRLGETVGVSESTVVRFAAELGFDGYPELQKAVQELVRSKLNSIQRIEVTRARMADDEVLDHILTYDMANIRQTLDELPRDTFYKAVDAVIHARKVYIFGAGSCRSLANFTAYYLKMLCADIHLVYTSSEMEILEEMFAINDEDVLIGLSFPRYSSKAVKTLHFAHSRNAKIVAITDSQLSPIAPYADYLLLAHSDMATIVDSLVAPLSIINALIVAVAVKTLDQNRDKLKELENLWDTYRAYTQDNTEVPS